MPDLEAPGVFTVSKRSSLRSGEGYAGREKYGYGGDLKKLPKISKDQFYSFLAEEKPLREKIRTIDYLTQSLQEVIREFRERNLIDSLLTWEKVHKRNRLYQMKMKHGDVLLTPSTQKLLEVAKHFRNNRNNRYGSTESSIPLWK